MTRNFIDYGIDLGTTNSCIAVFENGEAKVIKKGYSDDYIPSAVRYDQQGSIIVGNSAKADLNRDPENTFSEFKLQMGTDWSANVPNINRRITPVDLSAEILKELKGMVQTSRGKDEDISAAVITIPAAFGLAKSDATRKAAQKAGIVDSPLLQEPIAAALAYGFERTAQKGFWFVYDFGGGTFDAAIIKSSEEGIIQVVNHGGDNHLGGKLIDWAIVEELLIPEIKRVHGWTDFGRGNPNWIAAIAILKEKAEEAKKRLSSDPTCLIDGYLTSGDGQVKHFEYLLRREQIETLSERYILQSINICKKVLSEKNIQPGDIEKVILVGGPTMMPYLQQRLADPVDGLGISLEYKINPMTVVAQGAAIFAANRPKQAVAKPSKPGIYRITSLDHQPIGTDQKPMVGGIVVPPDDKQNLNGYKIEFINKEARIPWQSGKNPLGEDGRFLIELWAPDKNNNFLIELTDSLGNKLDIEPNSISRTIGAETIEPPLPESYGIALVNNKVEWLCRKGTLLPYKRTLTNLCSAYHIGQEMADSTFNIPIVEGENEKADRNQLIGSLEIRVEQLKSDLRAGTEIEVTIEIDESRLLKITVDSSAFVEKVKEDLQTRQDDMRLTERTEQIMKRYEDVRQRALEIGEPKPLAILNDLGSAGIIREINKQKAALSTDPSAPENLDNKLRAFTVGIDDVEDLLEIPEAEAQAHKALIFAQKVVENVGEEVDRQNFQHRQREMLAVIRDRNLEDLRRKTNMMYDFAYQILERFDSFWIKQLDEILGERDLRDYTDSKLAAELLAQGRNAMNAGEIERLKTAVRQLWQLLPQSRSENGRFKTDVDTAD